MRARLSPLWSAVSLLVALPAHAALEVVADESVSERFLQTQDGETYLRIDDREWTMITDPHDPSISSLGDGEFHPMSVALVNDALSFIDPLCGKLDGRVLVLPYPRRDNLKSSCEGNLVLLSPGIQEVAPEHVQATTIHEIGHLFQHTYAPEGSIAWEHYLDVRGLRDARFADTAAHRDRPREIFAEDFRSLFGTALATASGSIENPDLLLPSQVPGLREWMSELSRRPLPPVRENALVYEVFPNPARRGELTEIRFSGDASAFTPASAAAASRAWVLDLSGRRVRELRSSGAPSRFVWDGTTEEATAVSAGVYFVRWIDHPQAPAARVHVLR
ncbi:MAG TPA: hypothetical protein VFR10_02915 [bacterium]|nr:hypothetical protein [bacterium]